MKPKSGEFAGMLVFMVVMVAAGAGLMMLAF